MFDLIRWRKSYLHIIQCSSKTYTSYNVPHKSTHHTMFLTNLHIIQCSSQIYTSYNVPHKSTHHKMFLTIYTSDNVPQKSTHHTMFLTNLHIIQCSSQIYTSYKKNVWRRRVKTRMACFPFLRLMDAASTRRSFCLHKKLSKLQQTWHLAEKLQKNFIIKSEVVPEMGQLSTVIKAFHPCSIFELDANRESLPKFRAPPRSLEEIRQEGKWNEKPAFSSRWVRIIPAAGRVEMKNTAILHSAHRNFVRKVSYFNAIVLPRDDAMRI
jgi:hypothetical protein